MLINIWGICEFAEMTHDPLRRWDFSCKDFTPKEVKRIDSKEQHCANCIHWLIADELLEGKKI